MADWVDGYAPDNRADAFALLDLDAPQERSPDASIVHALIYIGDQLGRIADALPRKDENDG